MTEKNRVSLSEMFDGSFPSTDERLNDAYRDPVVHERSLHILHSSNRFEGSALRAQLTTYLAAAYALFPEESQIILDSLDGDNQS